MEIVDHNSEFFRMVPDNATEANSLKRFPGFRLIKSRYYLPKKPHIVQNVIGRFKQVHKKPIKCCKCVVDMMSATTNLLEIPKDFPWLTKPYPHQELSLRFLYTHGSAGLLLEPGLGKTYVVLNYIKLMGFNKSIVIAPKALMFVWKDEAAEHRPDLKVHVMESTSWEAKILNANSRASKWNSEMSNSPEGSDAFKKARANYKTALRELERLPDEMDQDLRAAEEADVVIINYEKVAGGLDLLERLNFDFVAIDEGLMKSMKTARTKAIHKLGSKIPYRCIMSGTLINNGPLDAFSPVKFIEPALCGGAYGAFEEYYAKIVNPPRGRRFVAGVGRRQTEEIRDILATCSIVMTKEEWLDLPAKSFNRTLIPMTPQQEYMYDTLAANGICKLPDGRYLEVNNPLTTACYLNQIANGFLYLYDDGDDGFDDFADLRDDVEDEVRRDKGPRETMFLPCNKGQALKDLIESEISDRKFILWYNMQGEYSQICHVLDNMGIEYRSIKGGCKDTGGIVHEFNKSGTIQVLVCQSQSVNYGITVLGRNPEDLEKSGVEVLPNFDTSVHTHVFWSLGWSLERYTQQQDRSHRIGQTHEVDYHILATDCGIENLVWDRLDKKECIRDSILVDYIKGISR